MGRCFNRGAQAGAAGPDHQHVMFVRGVVHQKILPSVQMPIEHRRT